VGKHQAPVASFRGPGRTINASTRATARPPGDGGLRRAISRLSRAVLAGTVGLAAAGGLVALAGQAQAAGWQSTTGAVYTMTNSATGNAIEAYGRASDGTLTPAGTYPTGGAGGTLDSGHSIVVSGDGRVLVNVNAGSDSVSAFAEQQRLADPRLPLHQRHPAKPPLSALQQRTGHLQRCLTAARDPAAGRSMHCLLLSPLRRIRGSSLATLGMNSHHTIRWISPSRPPVGGSTGQPGDRRRTSSSSSPRASISASTPCSAAWSGSAPVSTVSSPRVWMRRPGNAVRIISPRWPRTRISYCGGRGPPSALLLVIEPSVDAAEMGGQPTIRMISDEPQAPRGTAQRGGHS
jgi:hypothetical protein